MGRQKKIVLICWFFKREITLISTPALLQYRRRINPDVQQ